MLTLIKIEIELLIALSSVHSWEMHRLRHKIVNAMQNHACNHLGY